MRNSAGRYEAALPQEDPGCSVYSREAVPAYQTYPETGKPTRVPVRAEPLALSD